jgi:U3 small nucleolar RNA-associated protein 21
VPPAPPAPVAALHFLPGQPLLISAGGDNALKEWLFDADGAGPADGAGGHDPGAPPRLLRFRSGHAAPPTLARHYGDGARILSGGQDRAFRLFSAVQDAQSREMSQRHVAARAKRLRVEAAELKLGRLVALDTCDVRERDWANVLTAHEGDAAAYVWRLADGALGEHVLAPPPRERLGAPAPPAPVTAVALSRCGNFAFVGAADGALHRYNMQSGLHRGRFARAGGVPAHAGALVGLAPDGANRHLASAGADGAVRRWSFDGRALTGELALGAPVARVASHPPSGLLAAACDDLGVRLVDVEAMRVVRRFRGHADRITDLALSADGRWLLTAAMDNTLRVWDVPGACLFCFVFIFQLVYLHFCLFLSPPFLLRIVSFFFLARGRPAAMMAPSRSSERGPTKPTQSLMTIIHITTHRLSPTPSLALAFNPHHFIHRTNFYFHHHRARADCGDDPIKLIHVRLQTGLGRDELKQLSC